MRQRYLINPQDGQTLIETIAAIFILTMALTTGLAMAIFALSTATRTHSQIVAANLSREGIDVVRMMRDSNWLAAGAAAPPSACADLGNRPCYPQAFTGPTFNFSLPNNSALGDNFYRVMFDPVTHAWKLDSRSGSENYFLCLNSDGTYVHNDPAGSGIGCDVSNFARRVRISTRSGTSFGYSVSDPDNQEVIVQSIVQWTGKNCPAMPTTPNATPGACKVVTEERLTNWKDYR